VSRGRHAVLDKDDQPVGTYRMGILGRLGLVSAAVVSLLGVGVLLGGNGLPQNLPFAMGPACTHQSVDVVVSPELVSVVDQILAPIQGDDIGGNHCLRASVRGQEPQQTVISSDVLPLDRAPQVWVPDATVWGAKATRWTLASTGTLATSPVVLATSNGAVKELGWSDKAPTWEKALRGKRPVAVPDYESQSESLDALIALWQSLGKGAKADQAVVATVFAADRGELPSQEQAVSDARSGSVDAPLFPASEQAVAYLNSTATQPNLQAVYPKEGSPLLNYPVYQVSGAAQTASQQKAAQAVANRLISDAAQSLVRRAGFRDATGNPAIGQGINQGRVTVLTPPGEKELDGMIGRIDALAKPTRLLGVFDVSLSMKSKLADGLTRIQLTAAATRLGVNLLPDSGSVGAWVFSSRMDGDKDYKVIAPVRRLGSLTDSGELYRGYLLRLTNNLDQYLHGGGTSLYDTTIASMKYMHETFDKRANNSIILLSDGANEDGTGATLKETLAEIKKLNRGREKVTIYTAALGPDADFSAMKKIADASGGHAYQVDNALDGQTALLDGLRRNRHLGQ
jgi:ABC-type Fe3+ transport system substrate-binding protein